jgi:hypothetical protein
LPSPFSNDPKSISEIDPALFNSARSISEIDPALSDNAKSRTEIDLASFENRKSRFVLDLGLLNNRKSNSETDLPLFNNRKRPGAAPSAHTEHTGPERERRDVVDQGTPQVPPPVVAEHTKGGAQPSQHGWPSPPHEMHEPPLQIANDAVQPIVPPQHAPPMRPHAPSAQPPPTQVPAPMPQLSPAPTH